MTPIPTFDVTEFKAWADSRWDGIADNELGVTCSHSKEDRDSAMALKVITKVDFGFEIAILVKNSKLFPRYPLKSFEESLPKCCAGLCRNCSRRINNVQ